jgi:probable rRNA maturation factor
MSVSKSPIPADEESEPPLRRPRLRIDVQRAIEDLDIPGDQRLRSWIQAALSGRIEQAELTVRLVDEAESARLNREYRGKDASTNVLSFPLQMPPEAGIAYLGDLIICAPVVRREAGEQGKSLQAHWAHMLVHGSLHLLGYDHQNPRDAREMEALEIRIMADIGFPNPYEAQD